MHDNALQYLSLLCLNNVIWLSVLHFLETDHLTWGVGVDIDWSLSYWAWNKGYHRYKWICFISWHTHRNWMWGRIKNETLRQKRWFQFSHCELSIYMVQHSDSTYLHMEYTSKFMWYSRVCDSYQDFLNRRLLLTRNILNKGFLVVKLKSSLRKFFRRLHDLVNSFRISGLEPQSLQTKYYRQH